MIHLVLPYGLAALLLGTGLYGILVRRNAVLMLVGVELVLAAAGLLLVTAGATEPDTLVSGQVLTIFLITVAAAEVVLALGIITAVFRARGDIDLVRAGQDDA